MNLLLRMMQGQSNRKAQFRTVICMIQNDSTYYFEGSVGGNITLEPRGTGGFGYDPIFIPEGHALTFAEMTPTQKNGISHRARAVSKWIEFLRGILLHNT
jgi:XTP/dITP diphosphohydrolase